MRRAVSLAVLWVVAAAVATFVAWQGVALVGEQVTERPSQPLAAETTDGGGATGSTTTTEPAAVSTSSTTQPSGPSVPAGSGSGSSGSSGSGSSGTESGSGSAGSGPSGGSGGNTTTSVPAPAGVTRTYNLIGGDVALRFESGGVQVLYATPRPGFTVDIGSGHGTGSKVEFEGDGHRSQVEGWWDGGPVDEVREDSED